MSMNPNAASQPNGVWNPSRFAPQSTAMASSTGYSSFPPAYQATSQSTAPVSPAALQGQTAYSFNNNAGNMNAGSAYNPLYTTTSPKPAPTAVTPAPVVRNFYYTYPSNAAPAATPTENRKFHWKKFLFNTISTIAGTAVVVGGIGFGLSRYLGMSPKEIAHRVRAIGQVCMTVPMPAIDSALAFMKTGDVSHLGAALGHGAGLKAGSATGGHSLDSLADAIVPGHTVQSLQDYIARLMKAGETLAGIAETCEKKEVGKVIEYFADFGKKCQDLKLEERVTYASKLFEQLEADGLSDSVQYLNDMMKTCQDQNAKEGLANLLKLMHELKNKSALRILSGF